MEMEYDVFAMIADLEAQIESGKKVPFTNQYVIDKEAVMGLVQTIRDNLPEAIKEANRVLKNESRILQDAKKHYDNLVAEADAKAKNLRHESEQRAQLLTTTSEEKAELLLSDAERQSAEMLENAERKAQELVDQTAIVIRAQQQANDILTNARAEAQRDRRMSLDHCEELFKHAEDVAIDVANQLRNARMQLDQER